MRIEIDGTNIDYNDAGAGLPVVFIHAFPLNQTMWDEQVAALRSGFRPVTIDLRGFGKSDAPGGAYTVDRMAADVRAVMSALSIERAVIAGCSMGGYVALAFYRNYPGAVRGLLLSDTRASADTEEARERREKSAEKAEREGARAIADDMTPLLLGDTSLAARPEVVERVRRMAESSSPEGIAAAQRGMAARPDSVYMLAGIDRPSLILVGSEDKITGLAEAEALRDGIPRSRLRVIEAAGHLPNLERPAEFNKALTDFLVAEFGA
ncbi:MAG TPA: alpha/beta hydrolase [Blastocatellia bacterium]|nr:alpha/beta hydrolase [Blastocatellia bacterium]